MATKLETIPKGDFVNEKSASLPIIADEGSADIAGAKLDTTIRSSGYTFAIDGYNSRLKLDTTLLGGYTKAGNPDLIVIGTLSADFLDSLSGNPIPAKLANFARGKKYIFVVIGGTGIAAVFSKNNNFPPGMPTVGTKLLSKREGEYKLTLFVVRKRGIGLPLHFFILWDRG